MHRECYLLFENLASRLLGYENILEVGSYDENGSIRPLFEGYNYIGCDMSAGKCVDVVQENPHILPFDSESFDIVLSASCLEHCRRPWELILEMDRVLRGGGLLVLTIPWKIGYHPFPLDYWRISPDGFDELLGPWMKEHNRSPYIILQNRLDIIDTYVEALKNG